MSRFASGVINAIKPYVPGEQLNDKRYVKLNTNENPYFTSEQAVDRISHGALSRLNRYSDPENVELIEAIAAYYKVKPANVMVTNGSDEALAFCFMAYAKGGVCYPDVTYGFYDVIAGLFECPVEHIALNSEFKIIPEKYFNKGKTVVIANPNAQTGIALKLKQIEEIVRNNPDNIVIVDQAYADFSGENAIELIDKYENLVVINTFSKSRSLAGARVGYVIACEELITDIKKVKNSFHPYNVNTLSAALATEAIKDDGYFKSSVINIVKARERLVEELRELNFSVLPSSANFVLAKSADVGGEELYKKLKEKGVLVRYFSDERIVSYIRITVGTPEEMATLIERIKEIIAR